MVVLPAQRELLESTAKVVSFVGGYGSGKTRGLVYKAIQLALENPGCIGMFVEPSYTMIKDVAVPSFQEILEELQIPYRYMMNDHVMIIGSKHRILFRSGDEPNRLVGVNAAYALMDEPAKQSEEVAKALVSRLRDPRAARRQFVLGGTPEGFDWHHDWSMAEGTHLIRARTYDNPFLPEDYIRGLEARLTPEEVRAYINGEFVSFDGAWFRQQPTACAHELLDGMRVFMRPEQTSGQLILGVDTGGGVDRDACSLALVDKRDLRLVASWKDATASIDTMTRKARLLVDHFTTSVQPHFPGLYSATVNPPPEAVVEKNGIGMATVQQFRAAGIQCVELHTTEATRYAGMLAVRNAVSAGQLFGPPELLEEARLLTVKAGDFKGPKDLSMAIGMAYNHIDRHPYVKPAERKPPTLNVGERLGRRGNSW